MVPAPEPPGAVGGLLQKAGDYVLRYEQAFRNVVAEEQYEQESSLARDAASVERLRSEVVFAMLPGPVPWTLLRDVLQADHRVLREAGRLEPLFRASPSAGLREANAIARESETLILGPAVRTLNVPTMALAYLHPDNRDAFNFDRKGRAEVGGQSTVEISFEEVARPTLNQDSAGGDVPIRGTFCVRESDGAVLRSRTELVLDVTGAAQGRMTVVTEYRDDTGMGLPVPVEMKERIEWHTEQARRLTCSGPVCQKGLRPYLTGAAFASVTVYGGIEGKARYSGFRRVGSERHP
jgi:hypothetical protein